MQHTPQRQPPAFLHKAPAECIKPKQAVTQLVLPLCCCCSRVPSQQRPLLSAAAAPAGDLFAAAGTPPLLGALHAAPPAHTQHRTAWRNSQHGFSSGSLWATFQNAALLGCHKLVFKGGLVCQHTCSGVSPHLSLACHLTRVRRWMPLSARASAISCSAPTSPARNTTHITPHHGTAQRRPETEVF